MTLHGPEGDAPSALDGQGGEIAGLTAGPLRTPLDPLDTRPAPADSELRYLEIFEVAGVSLWVEDLEEVKAAIEELRAQGVVDFRAYVSAHPEFVRRALALRRVVDVNPETVRVFGARTKADLLRSLADVVTPESEAVFQGMLVALAEGKHQFRAEVAQRTLQGAPLALLITAHFGATGDCRRAVVTLTDVTERKQAELAWRGGERRLRRVADEAPVMVWVTKPDATCTYLSRSWYHFTGQARASGLGLGWLDAVHPDERTRVREGFLAASARQEPFRLEYRLRRKDGAYRWAIDAAIPRRDTAGRFLGHVGCILDITDRKQDEEALRDSEERFRTLADHMSQFAWMADAQGWIFWYNRRWYEYTGTTLEQMQGWGWTQVHHPDHVGRVVRKIQHAWDTGEEWEDTFPLRGKDGQYRWFLSRAVPIRDTDGRILRWLGTNTDVTAQRAAEEALKDADRRKDAFLATLAHELRNPLAPIRNSVEILRLSGGRGDVAEQARQTIERQLRQMVRIVDDLLDLSRITRDRLELRKEHVALSSIVESAVETSRPLIAATGHRLTVTVAPDTVWLQADLTRMTQVVANLLNNAAKFTPEGGAISLTAEREGGDAVIRVRDTGIGIPPAALPHIFDMFRQGETSREHTHGGLGIGLTLVKRLVELHGGTVAATSGGDGHGSEFTVRLPIAPAEPPPRGPGIGGERPRSVVPARRILVVDDNRDAAGSLGVLLNVMGHEVRTAHDGATAVEVARTFRPEVALLDIGMPGMSGYELAQLLRRLPQLQGIVLVAVTGWGQDGDRRRSRDAGFDHHLTKPADLPALEELLATLDARRDRDSADLMPPGPASASASPSGIAASRHAGEDPGPPVQRPEHPPSSTIA
jgi:PAS domain S-box-containing protein